MSLIVDEVPLLSICSSVCGCVLVMMSSSLPTAITLSHRHIKIVFDNTTDLDRLSRNLHIPSDKRNPASAADYYKNSTEPRKARSLVYWLDYVGDTSLAESVMECAEPPAGM